MVNIHKCYPVKVGRPWYNVSLALSDPESMKFSHIIKQSPRNWGTTVCKIVALTVFLHTKYMHACTENSQNYTSIFCCSPIPGRMFQKGKLWDRFVPKFFLHFMTFSPQLGTNNTLQFSSDSFPHMVIYTLCVENCQNYILTHSCLPIAGRLYYNVRKLHGPSI